MIRARIYLRNLTANWIGYGLNLVIMFAMSPFVIHRLGDVDYGVWSLMMTMTGYLGLVEVGTRGGVGRFLNYYLAKKDFLKFNSTVNTAMVIFIAIGGVLIVISLILAFILPNIFPKIPEYLIPDTRIILFLISFNVWISFFSVVFRHIIGALERFDLRNIADIFVLLIRTGMTIFALLNGYRLISLAVIQAFCGLLGLLIVFLMSKKIFPQLEICLTKASQESFKELFGFSVWAFIGSLSYRLLYSADNIVIGILLGPKWITFYSVGGLLLYRGRELINQASSVFEPKLIQNCATNELENLKKLYHKGSTLVMAVGLLVFIGMLVFGKEFIFLWMGPRFEISYQIMVILTVSSFGAVAFQLSGPIYHGMGKVKLLSLLILTQGLANLALTLFLVLKMNFGIEGVAWGSFYPRILWSIITGLIVMRWIKYDMFKFIFDSILRWLVLGIIFGLLCLWIDRVSWPSSWIFFVFKTLIATFAYLPISFYVLLNKDERFVYFSEMARRFNCRKMTLGEK